MARHRAGAKMDALAQAVADAWAGRDVDHWDASLTALAAKVHDCQSARDRDFHLAEAGLAERPSRVRQAAERKVTKLQLLAVPLRFASRLELLTERLGESLIAKVAMPVEAE